MPISDEKQYLINGTPVTARELIEEATCHSPEFADQWLKTTSAAAATLRRFGMTVLENPDAGKATGD